MYNQDNFVVKSSKVCSLLAFSPTHSLTYSLTHLFLFILTHSFVLSFRIVVTGHNDDPNGSHIQITCISNEFKGKTIVQRQRLIYKAIWDEMSGPTAPVHAVDSIIAKTPEEANM